ncbi:MAG: glycosyltransferase family 2 protein [Acidobacteria bacterium]|jgi:NDP-sugar pyrophosphorylase family protein|nr:glycosyltransferase family 2 protein [Acidobacteriota bacterium]
MNFVIPMAGRGKRFSEAGYLKPKPLIEVGGKTLLQWSVDSLPLALCTNLIFVILMEHEQEYKVSEYIRQWYKDTYHVHFVFLTEVTRGQAETVLKAGHLLTPDEPLLIYNIDTYFRSGTLTNLLRRGDIDGVLGAFNDDSSRFSFAKTNHNGFVTEVAEKIPISANALTGLYHFSRGSDFLKVAEESLRKNDMTKGEFYVAPMYNKLIAEGKKYVLDFCSQHYILGTPAELKVFEQATLLCPRV